MNTTTTHTRRTSRSARRTVPALAIVVLAVGLGACQTPPRAGGVVEEVPVVEQVQVPEGIDTRQPADRIEAELERRAQSPSVQSRHVVADRLDTQLATRPQSPSVQSRHLVADRLDTQPATPKTTAPSLPADRLDQVDYIDPTERIHVPGGGSY